MIYTEIAFGLNGPQPQERTLRLADGGKQSQIGRKRRMMNFPKSRGVLAAQALRGYDLESFAVCSESSHAWASAASRKTRIA